MPANKRHSEAEPRIQGPRILARQLTFEVSGNTILSEVSLAFRPGEFTAIIGPSGSGKSTLLKCLSTVHAPTDGNVLVDGNELSNHVSHFRQRLGYVPQDDIMHCELRVRQAFYYSAKLRLRPDLTGDEIEKQIETVTGQLGLTERRRHRIRSLSGGQRKRVNIGIELLADPDVLVLDEPASGLDPATEEDLVTILRRLASENRTIIMTTHSMEQLSRVNNIVMLMEGAVIFAGSLDELTAHFEIPHVAEAFKKIRGKSKAHWQTMYHRSPLARKAMTL